MISTRVDTVNYVINKYNYTNPDYLEIGVFQGTTIKNVHSTNKDGVDTEDYCKCNFVNYKMTSDNFFSKHIEKQYDIIFIDGLHTAYQVSKDIYNSLNNLKNDGIILIDDVYPHNEFEQRGLDLSNKGANTGDVWKAIYSNFSILCDISSDIIFFPDVDRGMISFRINDSAKNIKIDDTIPMVDNGIMKEWNKITYSRDFETYLNSLRNYEIKYQ